MSWSWSQPRPLNDLVMSWSLPVNVLVLASKHLGLVSIRLGFGWCGLYYNTTHVLAYICTLVCSFSGAEALHVCLCKEGILIERGRGLLH